MYETSEDLADLQEQLDESYASAGEHLRSIFTAEQRASAEDVAAQLTGIFLINLATVTKYGEPIVAPVDGLFYRGRLWFGLPPGSLRARHLHARPQVSATLTDCDSTACLIMHGIAEHVTPAHDLFEGFDTYARELYGIAIDYAQQMYGSRSAPDFSGFIRPRRIYAHAFPKTAVG